MHYAAAGLGEVDGSTSPLFGCARGLLLLSLWCCLVAQFVVIGGQFGTRWFLAAVILVPGNTESEQSNT
jgi:hypothetical protein